MSGKDWGVLANWDTSKAPIVTGARLRGQDCEGKIARARLRGGKGLKPLVFGGW